MVQFLRALLTSGAVALLLATAAPSASANQQIVPNGRGASAVTDRDGVTHMVYNIPNGTAPDTFGYCRIARGADTCQDTKVFSLQTPTLDCEPRPTEDFDDEYNWDDPEVMITPFGEVFVQVYGWCTDVYRSILFTSTDQGDTFDTGHLLARRSWEPIGTGHSEDMTYGESVLDPADRTVVSAISLNYPTNDATLNGGLFIQSAPLGGYTTALGRLTPANDLNAGYGGSTHPSIVQRGNRSYVVAWHAPYDPGIKLKVYKHPERPPSDVNDPSLWGAAIDVTVPGSTLDMPHLVSGPLGTFLMYRTTLDVAPPNSAPGHQSDYVIRRLNADDTLGPATTLPFPSRYAPLTNSQIYNHYDKAAAALVEDQANGRLHYARWVPGLNGRPHAMQYLVSDDGTTWSAERYLPSLEMATSLDPGDFGLDDTPESEHDPALAEATGVNGFAGTIANARGWRGAHNGRIYYPFGALPLPDSGAPPAPGGGGGDGGGGTPPPSGGGGGGASGGGGTTTAPPPDPEDRRCKILQFAALDVLADACLTQEKGVFIARGGVSVNGLKLAGAEVRFDPKELSVTSTGPVEVSVGATKLFKDKISWKLPKANVFDLGNIDVSALGGKLFGFGLKGDVDVKFVRGAVEIGTHLGMPGMLGGITADVTARADNLAGLHVRELHIAFASAKLGPLELADVEFNYNPDEDQWGGTLQIHLPPSPPGAALKGSIEFKDGEITALAGQLTLPSPGIALDPFSVAWLTKIRASMKRPPLTLSGGITMGAGPLLDKTSGDRPITVDGDITITLPDSGPATFRGDGVGSVMGIPIATAYLQYVTSGQISAGGHVDYDFGPFHASGGIDGWFYKNAFDLHGAARVCAGICIGGDAVFSSVGFAACADVGFTEIGAGITWGNDLALGLINPFYLLRHIDVMPVGCDVGDYEAKASAAQAAPGGERSVTFGKDLPSGFVGVVGQGAPPHVALVGPDGTRVEPTAAATVRTPGAFAFQSAKGNLTWFAVKAPKPGTWKIVPEADSVPIASVAKADGLPAPKVTATVKRPKSGGRSRVLSYNIAPLPGQTVTFSERGAKGIGAPLGKAKGSKGTLRFTPAPGPGGTRKIIAAVAQKGVPRKELTVARYVAPAPPKPARPKLVVKRVGTKLVVSWAKDGVAKRWTARITLSDGRVLVLLPRKPAVSVAGVAKATTGRIAVYGETAANVKGPTATATLRAAKAKAKPKARRR